MHLKNEKTIIGFFLYARARAHAKRNIYIQTRFNRFNWCLLITSLVFLPVSFHAKEKSLEHHRRNQAKAAAEGQNFIQSLITDLKSHPDAMVRQGAAQLLGNYAKQTQVGAALNQALLNDSSADVQGACILSLTLADPVVAMVGLRRAARSGNPALRAQAAYSLERIENAEAKKILKQLKKDPHPVVRETANRKGKKSK